MLANVKKNISFLIAILVGMSAIASFYFFYTKQKKFLSEQKEFLITLDTLQIETEKLKFAVLQNFIYAYNNNDIIISRYDQIDSTLTKLKEAKILTNPKYIPLQKQINQLDKYTKKLFTDLQHYLMINAAVKNSMLFLASSLTQLDSLADKELLLRITKSIESLLFAKRMGDISFLKNIYRIEDPEEYPKALQPFLHSYELHVHFILANLPKLLSLKEQIESNSLSNIIDEIKKRFSAIAIKDTQVLNTFALILFTTFTLTYIYLIVILIRYKKEHASLQQTTKTLQYSLTHDLLTGLKNRFAFDHDKTKTTHPLIMLVNIDRFKDINDVFGNQAGNELLRAVAKQLQTFSNTESSFVDAYRIGGDEFCLLFENFPTQKAVSMAHKLFETISQNDFLINGNEINISISIALCDKKPLLENADLALKIIKTNRNKKIILYDESLDLHKKAESNIKTIRTIRQALQNDNVIVYYQPIVNLKNDQIEKFEALVRIRHENKVIAPYFFLNIARKTHLYQELTRRVVEHTLLSAANYPQYRFSINLSVSDILNETLVEEIFSLFEQHVLTASRIDIELLETEELYDLEAVKLFIERAHSFGSLILIDDFGSGYSNFSYFAELQIDILKIDGSIIKEIATNKRKRHMFESIVMFARGMNLKIVAEFVDDSDVLAILKETGIEYAQGYLFSPPMPTPKATLKKLKQKD